MMPLCEDDDDYYRAGMRGTPTTTTMNTAIGRGHRVATVNATGLQARRQKSIDDVDELAKEVRRVQFSDTKGLELENTQLTTTTHHPTPVEAKQVIHNTSSRRYTIDEVELYFSEDTKFPAAVDDYVVRKFISRNDIIIGGQLGCKEVSLLQSRWTTYWAELYNGVLMLHKYKDVVEKKRVIVPISGCSLQIADMRECIIDIHFLYQGHHEVKSIKCESKADLFLWWWALQLASVDRDEKALYHTMKKQNFLTPLQLLDLSTTVEHVLFPRPARLLMTRRTPDRPCITHLIIVRHGETENIHFRVADKEKGLTKRGQEQAALVATHLAKQLVAEGADGDNVQLVFGGLQRTFETAKEFEQAMPWLKYTNECCLLEDGAPKAIDHTHRMDFRASMHLMASEYLCRFDPQDPQHPTAHNTYENYKILIGHSSFIQHCIAQSYGISKEVVKIGAPIGHCSITQIDIIKDGDKPEHAEVVFANRVKHLPLTHRTSE